MKCLEYKKGRQQMSWRSLAWWLWWILVTNSLRYVTISNWEPASDSVRWVGWYGGKCANGDNGKSQADEAGKSARLRPKGILAISRRLGPMRRHDTLRRRHAQTRYAQSWEEISTASMFSSIPHLCPTTCKVSRGSGLDGKTWHTFNTRSRNFARDFCGYDL